MKTCFFMGHRDAPYQVEALLRERVVHAITQYSVSDFVVGLYGNFDRMAAQAVRIAKKRYPFVTLTLLRPYHPAQRPISLPAGFDASLYPLWNGCRPGGPFCGPTGTWWERPMYCCYTVAIRETPRLS